jgi:hypothetical protein
LVRAMFTRRSSSPYHQDFFVFALVRNSTFSATVPVFLGLSSVERKGTSDA